MKTTLFLVAVAALAACGGEETENLPLVVEAECERDEDCAVSNPCEESKCIAAKCVAEILPDGAACDDENICTLVDYCHAGTCVGQELDLQVIVQDLCLLITCDPKEGYAVGFQPDGTACVLGQCNQGVCIPAAEKSAN